MIAFRLQDLASPRRPSGRLAPLILAWWVVAGSVGAQETVEGEASPAPETAAEAAPSKASSDTAPTDEPAAPFVEIVDVSVVNVEVFVTDKDGNRIEGLEKDDFVLKVDKKPVQITNFFAVEGGKAAGAEPTESPETTEISRIPDRSVRTLPMREDVPTDQQLHLIVYVDNYNLHPFSRNRTLRSLRTFLRTRLQTGDRVMLVSYDRSFHVRMPFTADHQAVAAATYELEELSAHAVHATSERRDLLQEIYESEDDNPYYLASRASTYAGSLYNDLEFSLDSIRDLVESLAGIPGRKAVLYVSDGLPLRPGEDMYHAIYDRFGDSSILMDANRFDLTRRFSRLTQQANAHRVTFYTMDAAGLRTYSYMDVTNRNPGGGSTIDRIHFSNIQSSLMMLARETGGQVLMNTNDFGPMLEKVADDFDSFYSLGFMPASGESGRYHDIRVELVDKPRGAEIRHRDGYRDKPLETRMAEGTLAAVHYGIQDNELGVTIEPGNAQRNDSGTYNVPFAIRFPLGNLELLPTGEMYRGRVRLFMVAKDSEGGMAPMSDLEIPIDIPADEIDRARGQLYQYVITLEMRGGAQILALGVRDDIGATQGFVTRSLVVGS